jgi:hypothetical protein
MYECLQKLPLNNHLPITFLSLYDRAIYLLKQRFGDINDPGEHNHGYHNANAP